MLKIILFLIPLSLAYSQEYWEMSKTPVDADLNAIFAIDTAHIWVAADSGMILFTSDKGKTWDVRNTGIEQNIDKIFFLDENHGWGLAKMEGPVSFRAIILKSADGGINWSNEIYRVDDTFLNSIVFFDTLNGWTAGEPHELAYTSNGGVTWENPVFDSAHLFMPIYSLKFYNRQIGYGVGGYIDFAGAVWSTNDSGKTWSSLIITADPAYDIHIFNENYAYALSSDIERNYNIEVIRTFDAGNTWFTEIIDPLGSVTAIDFRTDTEGWATMGRDRLALFTSDGGKVWDYYILPDSSSVWDIQFIDSLNGFMVGDSGKFFTYVPQGTVSVENYPGIETPENFYLFQNYPNPFNAQTEIKYFLKSEAYVRLNLFNLLGQEVLNLYEGWQKNGVHSIKVDLNDIPAGVYFYKLSSGNNKESFNDVKKMILLK
jgi:photosystem II stability/assembly factor-like uncharacterized protein